MLKGFTRTLFSISPVIIRSQIPSLQYEKKYGVRRKFDLSNVYNTVTDDNRYDSLKILLSKLSGYVGRRQYKMQSNLTAKYFEVFKKMGVDWFDLKCMPRNELIDLFDEMGVPHTDRVLIYTVIDAKCCGVVTRNSEASRGGEVVCMRRGKAEHGWRCAVLGHGADVYFERKPAKTAVLTLELHRRLSVARYERENGVAVEARKTPDFAIVGRLKHEATPRVWSTPQSPMFDIMCIGYEFRVHPDDPRAIAQIEEARQEWIEHAEVMRNVIWEMLELYGVERTPQKLDLHPGEMGGPDSPEVYSSAFTTVEKRKASVEGGDTSPQAGAEITEDDIIIEQRLVHGTDGSKTGDAGRDAGNSHRPSQHQPWFLPPLPQRFSENSTPVMLPFAPTLIIRSSFRKIRRDSNFTDSLVRPVCDIKCFIHPDACFWWGDQENQEKVLAHVLSWAKKIPYALPFNLYFRVDVTKMIRSDEEFVLKRSRLMDEKMDYFDLSKFRSFWLKKHGDEEGTPANEAEPFNVAGEDAADPHGWQ